MNNYLEGVKDRMDNRTINEMLFNKEKMKILSAFKKIADNNPYYEKLFADNMIALDDSLSYDDFLHIPILTKAKYREKQSEIDKVLIGEKTVSHNTSGSTGKPIRITRTMSDETRMNYFLNRYRTRRIPNIVVKTGAAFHYINPKRLFEYQEIGYHIEKYTQNFWGFQYLFFSEVTYKACIRFLNDEKPAWGCASSSFWYNLAKYLLTYGGLTHQLEYIECNSEYLDEEMRKVISRAFGIEPVSMYGANELNAIAIQCRHRKMHILDDCVFCEIEPETNELIITSLCNYTNPFIRFRIGDIATWGESCMEECDLPGPVIELSGYRANDYCVINDKKTVDVYFFNGLFRRISENNRINIKQQRVVQYKDGLSFEIVIDSVPNGYMELLTTVIQNEVDTLFERPTNICVEFKSEILPDPVSGKFKYFISKIDEKHFQ